jgi:hypothetical protein
VVVLSEEWLCHLTLRPVSYEMINEINTFVNGEWKPIFSLDNATGIVTTTQWADINYESDTTSYVMAVRVTDNGADPPNLYIESACVRACVRACVSWFRVSASFLCAAAFVIQVLDANDPPTFDMDTLAMVIDENMPGNTTIGTIIVTDEDTNTTTDSMGITNIVNSVVSLHIVGGEDADRFSIDPLTHVVRAMVPLNYEVSG